VVPIRLANSTCAGVLIRDRGAANASDMTDGMICDYPVPIRARPNSAGNDNRPARRARVADETCRFGPSPFDYRVRGIYNAKGAEAAKIKFVRRSGLRVWTRLRARRRR
jgi:hypothetical protein